MSSVAPEPVVDETVVDDGSAHRESIWAKTVYKLRRDRLGMVGLSVVLLYFIVAIGVWLGIWATEWGDVEG
ncbi:MAG: hypothetical protein OES37_08135, partial [Chromatiales bacterium]|nr:hypothetical protein [Chromatiales bacterium]